MTSILCTGFVSGLCGVCFGIQRFGGYPYEWVLNFGWCIAILPFVITAILVFLPVEHKRGFAFGILQVWLLFSFINFNLCAKPIIVIYYLLAILCMPIWFILGETIRHFAANDSDSVKLIFAIAFSGNMLSVYYDFSFISVFIIWCILLCMGFVMGHYLLKQAVCIKLLENYVRIIMFVKQ
ncbi:MAG: hypothetical protein PHW69_08810 [Elusimicrobiaceae bacterium]|nr:hypothetical protein [Elusimicrobiaceae bacterium]